MTADELHQSIELWEAYQAACRDALNAGIEARQAAKAWEAAEEREVEAYAAYLAVASKHVTEETT